MTGVAGSAVDVVVVGGGPAGCAAAAAACRQGCSAVVLDRSPPREGRARGGSIREGSTRGGWRAGEGAGPGTERLVNEVFGPEAGAFRPDAHLRCPGIVAVWGSPEPSYTEHLLNPLGPAWNLDRHRFDADLRAGARALGAEVRTEVTGVTVEREETGWAVRFTTATVPDPTAPTGLTVAPALIAPTRVDSVRGRVVIDATGRGARVARAVGARRHQLDRLVALGAVWSVGSEDQAASTYVEADAQGWWYSALLPARRRMVAYLTDADLVPSDREQRRRLAQSARRLAVLGPVLTNVDAPSPVEGPRLVAARSVWLDRFDGEGWLAAGDAAFAVDPLSGQGIISALVTGRSAGLAASAMATGRGAATERARHRRELAANLGRALDGHRTAYRAEGRWPDHEFWARRRARAV